MDNETYIEIVVYKPWCFPKMSMHCIVFLRKYIIYPLLSSAKINVFSGSQCTFPHMKDM